MSNSSPASVIKQILPMIAGLGSAMAAAGLVAVSVELLDDQPDKTTPADHSRRPTPAIAHSASADPAAIPTTTVSSLNGRRVPMEILGTAHTEAAPWAPGIRLRSTRIGRNWENNRAEIEDLLGKDVRSYAIGDLLPHGSLLVGISTGTADVLVSDVEIVRLHNDGTLGSINDFRLAKSSPRIRQTSDLDSAFRDAVLETLVLMGDDDPDVVQRAIDELVETRDASVEIIIAHVDSEIPVTPAYYSVGSRSSLEPAFVGDIVIAILEEVSGQTFGDIMRPDIGSRERARITDDWLRWWGVE